MVSPSSPFLELEWVSSPEIPTFTLLAYTHSSHRIHFATTRSTAKRRHITTNYYDYYDASQPHNPQVYITAFIVRRLWGEDRGLLGSILGYKSNHLHHSVSQLSTHASIHLCHRKQARPVVTMPITTSVPIKLSIYWRRFSPSLSSLRHSLNGWTIMSRKGTS